MPIGYTLLALVVDCTYIKFVRRQQNWAIKFGNGEYFYGNKIYHFFKDYKIFTVVEKYVYW